MTDGAIAVRRCGHADIGAVLELWRDTRSSHASQPDGQADVERLIESSPAALFVAEAEGQTVGAVIAGWDGWRGNIYRLAVRREHRRRGVGRRLTRVAEDYLHGRGVRRITALVAHDDAIAGAFWDAAGYPRDAEIGRRVRNLERNSAQLPAGGDREGAVVGLDHAQVAAPPGCEDGAREFYGGILGLPELEKPAALRDRGGVWFGCGDQQLHVGVAGDFSPATKAHPALRVRSSDLDSIAARLKAAECAVSWDDGIPGTRRFYTADPWGNRIELLAAG